MKTILTIAGSDSIGGAGIQADIKTITVNGLYAMSVITAVTAQNTLGVQKIYPVSCECLESQLESVLSDITPDFVKIGMVCSKSQIDIIYKMLKKYDIKNIILDPVMVSTSGNKLADSPDVYDKLFSICTLVTPNIPEAMCLSGIDISDENQQKEAACFLGKKYGSAFLIKGGHNKKSALDILYDSKNNKFYYFDSVRIDNPNTHGTGCTLSSAIACFAAMGNSLEKSIKEAKKYIIEAINYNFNIGHGNGPLFHSFKINQKESEV
jgi:hydroxymethylpyrimidine/phosphomethylpyrimidine kinase